MKCPNCQVDLMMTERQGIEIDYCPQCRGVWLDRGELDKIIERSTATPSSSPSPQRSEKHRGREDDDDYRPHKKKESIWGDLFDFG